MDVVVERLEAATISTEPVESRTGYDVLYKNWGKLNHQEDRRNNLLEVQKSNRNSNLDKFRGILELVNACEDRDYFEPYNRSYYRPSIYVAGFNKAPSYNKVLMMSEWMVEKPSDFEENWLVVPSPKGNRVLVVATNGITRLFNKFGLFMFECRTALPGGNSSDPKSKKNCCVLDCFYQKKGNVLHVLDILAWNSQPMTDGELEFRDYWLRSQFLDLDAARVRSKKNELIFSLLPKVSCSPEHFNRFMMKVQFENPEDDLTVLDGLLFYHKKAHYFSGETPLVGWLYPYMVPEVLGTHITVNPGYMVQKPGNYTNQADYIIEFNSKYDKKKDRRHRRTSQMDTSDVSQENNSEESNQKTEDKPKTESMEAEPTPDSRDKGKSSAVPIEADTPIDAQTVVDVESTAKKVNDSEKVDETETAIDAEIFIDAQSNVDDKTAIGTETSDAVISIFAETNKREEKVKE